MNLGVLVERQKFDIKDLIITLILLFAPCFSISASAEPGIRILSVLNNNTLKPCSLNRHVGASSCMFTVSTGHTVSIPVQAVGRGGQNVFLQSKTNDILSHVQLLQPASGSCGILLESQKCNFILQPNAPNTFQGDVYVIGSNNKIESFSLGVNL